jgi:hypothetical protein
MATDADILGRDEQDDLDWILDQKPDWDATIRVVKDNSDTIFTWDYERSRVPLSKLYEKAKTAQWNGSTDLDWSLEVDQEKLAAMSPDANPEMLAAMGIDLTGSPMEKWTGKEWTELAIHQQNFMLSQFMHGEQGALVCTAKIVETVPWIDAKYYAATQVMDEARHVEVFARYLDEKLNGHFPLNPHLGMLLDDIISDERWDFTYLGMQIMVEGLALAAFGLVQAVTQEPLLQKLLRYVMSDEARHVAFGVLSLKEFYAAAVRLRDRLVAGEVWERMGVDPKVALSVMRPPGMTKNDDPFQMMLFSKIVPNLSKLGLLDANGQWLRKRFDNIGLTQFETWTDTSIEYELLDAVSADRAAAASAESA